MGSSKCNQNVTLWSSWSVLMHNRCLAQCGPGGMSRHSPANPGRGWKAVRYFNASRQVLKQVLPALVYRVGSSLNAMSRGEAAL